MENRERRLKKIELSLTPTEVVLVCLRNAMQAGTFKDASRHSPPYRSEVANAVLRTVRSSMKDQPELVIERAVQQARQEADLLFILAIGANLEVIKGTIQRGREYFLLGHLYAELRGVITLERVKNLRPSAMMFIEPIIILSAAITQIATEQLNGQPILFPECKVELEEQLEMAENLLALFNFLTREAGADEISLEKLRSSLQSKTDQQVSIWINQARLEAFTVFGTEQQRLAAVNQAWRSIEELAEFPVPR